MSLTAAHPDQPLDATGFILADDHAIVRQSVRHLLQPEPDLQLIAEAANGHEAIELCLQLEPDVLITDLRMPGPDGLEVTRQLADRLPELRIIGLSMSDDPATAQAMRNAGAHAFLSKTDDIARLADTIRHVAGQPARTPETQYATAAS